MSESETHKTVGIDGLIEFGQYLTTLADAPYRHYTFEMPDGSCVFYMPKGSKDVATIREKLT